MFSKDVRPNTYVNEVQVDMICKKLADKFGFSKIAYGVATFSGSNSTCIIDFTDACFTSPPVVVGFPLYSGSYSTHNNVFCLKSVSTTSATCERSYTNVTDVPLHWMAIGT